VLAGYWLGGWFFLGFLVITAHFGCLKIFKELVGFSKNMKKNQQFRGKLFDGPFDFGYQKEKHHTRKTN